MSTVHHYTHTILGLRRTTNVGFSFILIGEVGTDYWEALTQGEFSAETSLVVNSISNTTTLLQQNILIAANSSSYVIHTSLWRKISL